MYQQSSPHFTSDFIFLIRVNGYSTLLIDILNQIWFNLLTFIALHIFRNVFICCARLLLVCAINVQFTPRRLIDGYYYSRQNMN